MPIYIVIWRASSTMPWNAESDIYTDKKVAEAQCVVGRYKRPTFEFRVIEATIADVVSA